MTKQPTKPKSPPLPSHLLPPCPPKRLDEGRLNTIRGLAMGRPRFGPNTVCDLLGHVDTIEAELATAKAEVERLQAYKQMFDHAIACIDRVFQQCSENPHPILPDFCRLGADKFEAVILLAQEFVKVREESKRLREFRDWICTKLGLPLDAKDSQVYGAMHVACSHAHGYETYIQSHKCDDKQGEIARLTLERDEARKAAKIFWNTYRTFWSVDFERRWPWLTDKPAEDTR